MQKLQFGLFSLLRCIASNHWLLANSRAFTTWKGQETIRNMIVTNT